MAEAQIPYIPPAPIPEKERLRKWPGAEQYGLLAAPFSYFMNRANVQAGNIQPREREQYDRDMQTAAGIGVKLGQLASANLSRPEQLRELFKGIKEQELMRGKDPEPELDYTRRLIQRHFADYGRLISAPGATSFIPGPRPAGTLPERQVMPSAQPGGQPGAPPEAQPAGGVAPSGATAVTPSAEQATGKTPATTAVKETPKGQAKGAAIVGAGLSPAATQAHAAVGLPTQTETVTGGMNQPLFNITPEVAPDVAAERATAAKTFTEGAIGAQGLLGGIPDEQIPPGVDKALYRQEHAGISTSASLPLESEAAKREDKRWWMEYNRTMPEVSIRDKQTGEAILTTRADFQRRLREDPNRYELFTPSVRTQAFQISDAIQTDSFRRVAAGSTLQRHINRMLQLITPSNLGWIPKLQQFGFNALYQLVNAGDKLGFEVAAIRQGVVESAIEFHNYYVQNGFHAGGRAFETKEELQSFLDWMHDENRSALEILDSAIAYARATMREPGRLSVEDVRNASVNISAGSQNFPKAVVQLTEIRGEISGIVAKHQAILRYAWTGEGDLKEILNMGFEAPLLEGGMSQEVETPAEVVKLQSRDPKTMSPDELDLALEYKIIEEEEYDTLIDEALDR